MHTNVHSSPFVLHLINFRSLLCRNYLQIVRQSWFPSRAFKKQLTSHCRMLPCIQMCIPHLLFCISSRFGHFCGEITFKLSAFRISSKRLQEAVDEPLQNASMHTNVQSSPFVLHFITFRSLLCRNYLQIVRQSWFPSRAFKKQLTSYSGRTETDFALIFYFWDFVIATSNLS